MANFHPTHWASAAATVLAAVLSSVAPSAALAHDDGTAALVEMINAYRASAPSCNGQPRAALPALTPERALARVHIGAGTILQSALQAGDFEVQHAEAITVSGAQDPEAVMKLMKQRYCAALSTPGFTSVGAQRQGDHWQIVLAQPVAPLALSPWPASARALLAAVNSARAQARDCGAQRFGPTAPLTWQDALGTAALVHSTDMALHRSMQHKGSDGSDPATRAGAAGYRWRRIGENIAAGQRSVEEVMAGWLASPGHCSNIMEPAFTHMGAAFALAARPGGVFWTQLFGTPR